MDNTYSTQCLRKFQQWKLNLRVSDESIEMAKTERAQLMDSLTYTDLKFRAGATKVYQGNISPGCETCVNGLISFFYINGLCTRDCFFCPQNRAMENERPPAAAEMTFNEPDRYADYLETFGFRGVGFSGGEPLLVMDKLLLFLNCIKKRFAGNIYAWVYTNGDLIDERKLKDLRDAGMDEIRINVSARDYDLEPVHRARRYFENVTVEIPAIPEEVDRVKSILPVLADIGVKYFNVHQLSLSQYNYSKINERNYCMSHSPDGGLVILDSEMSALRLLKHASGQSFDFSLNYCSTIYKERYQSWGMRKQLARTITADYEKISGSGYILQLSAKGNSACMNQTISAFEKQGTRKGLWKWLKTTEGDSRLLFHPDLIHFVPQEINNLSFQCFEAVIIPDDQRNENRLPSFAEVRTVSDGPWVLGLKRLEIKDNVNAGFIKKLLSDCPWSAGNHLPEEHQTLRNLIRYIELEHGFSDPISTKTYWMGEKKRALIRQGFQKGCGISS